MRDDAGTTSDRWSSPGDWPDRGGSMKIAGSIVIALCGFMFA
jgi:hypothetical protein